MEFEYFVFARVLHVLAVVLWIGGVAMVTTVILPSVKRMKSKEEPLATFEIIEGRFALQAKITTMVTGVSGFYMIDVLDAWGRYLEVKYWWIHAMTLVWILFTMVLFVLEPLVLHKYFKKYGEQHPERMFQIIHRFHWVLFTLSLITVAGAVAGGHGWFWL